MANTNFTAWADEVVLASNYTIVAGEKQVLLTSPTFSNGSGTTFNSISCTIDYSDMAPNVGSFYIGAVVEALQANGAWAPIAYQFSDMRSNSQANQRIIQASPSIDGYNIGIDDIVFIAGEEVARISRSPGILPESEFRVRIFLKDNDPTGPGAFEKVTVSCSGELTNV